MPFGVKIWKKIKIRRGTYQKKEEGEAYRENEKWKGKTYAKKGNQNKKRMREK
jgi:hypothetical protein